ncbi:MAG: permease [Desulfotomaculales bacterium]
MKTNTLRKYALFMLVAAVDIFLGWHYPAKGVVAIKSSLDYLGEMLLFLPPIFVLVGLLDVWVPRQIVERNVGPESGARGVALSILVATAAAGPLYVGFPVAAALLKKGCRLANAVIFLGTWATIKIPMLMMEIKFMGLPFSLLRLALTLPAVIGTGYFLEMLLRSKEPGQPGSYLPG